MRGVVTILVMLALCASLRAGERVRIGLALPTQQEQRWVRDLRIIEEQAELQGADLRVRVARNDQDVQNRHVRELLEEGVDVLILAPHDASAAAPVAEEAKAKGVPVISYDRLVLDADLDAYLSFDSVRVGELQATWLIRRVPRGAYIVLSGADTDFNSTQLHDGAMSVLRPFIDNGDITVLADETVDDWQPAVAMHIVERVLAEADNRVDAIIAPNDGTAGGAIVALDAQGLAGRVAVTGQDADSRAARRIVAGRQSMTVLKDNRKLGEAGVRIAIMLARGEDIGGLTGGRTIHNRRKEVPAILLEPEMVDKDNLDRVLVDSGYMRRVEVYQ